MTQPTSPYPAAADVGEGARLSIRYIALSQVKRWEQNPKKHDLPALIDSLKAHGFRDAPIFDATLGAIVGGNGRIEALEKMHVGGAPPPAGILLAKGTKEWCVPVQFGIDAKSKRAAKAFAVDHNNLTLAGSGLSIVDMAQLWDRDPYLAIVKDLEKSGEKLASMTSEQSKRLVEDVFDYPDIDLEAAKVDDGSRGKLHVRVVFASRRGFTAGVEGLRRYVARHPEWKATIE